MTELKQRLRRRIIKRNKCPHCGYLFNGEYCEGCGKDFEGYTEEQRMRRRPRSEIYGAAFVPRPRPVKSNRPFADAVVPGSVRISRPLFGE